jgi:hypothetical protein
MNIQMNEPYDIDIHDKKVINDMWWLAWHKEMINEE